MCSSCAWTRAELTRSCTNAPREELRLVWPCSGTGLILCSPHTHARTLTDSCTLSGACSPNTASWEVSVSAEGISGDKEDACHTTHLLFQCLLFPRSSSPRTAHIPFLLLVCLSCACSSSLFLLGVFHLCQGGTSGLFGLLNFSSDQFFPSGTQHE